jgi:hypothetical protein
MRSRKMSAAKTGVRGTNIPVMKPAFVAVVRARPSVWSAKPPATKHPSTIPETAPRRSRRPSRPANGTASAALAMAKRTARNEKIG